MKPTTTDFPTPDFRSNSISKIAGFFAMAVGVLVLIGWLLGYEMLKRIAPTFVAMNPVTALCFILSGLALEFLVVPQVSRKKRWVAYGLAGIVALFGAIKLTGYVFEIPIRLDAFLFHLELEEAQLLIPNQMAPNTAFNFVMIGAALLSLDHPQRRFPVSNIFALLSSATALLAVVGYAYGVRELSRVSAVFIPMALHTGLGFLALAAGILLARHDAPIPRMFALPGSTRLIAKRLFPAATVFVLTLGWLRLYGERSGYFPGPLGTAMFVVIIVFVLTSLIWWTATTTGKVEQARRVAEQALAVSKLELEASYQHLQLIMNHATEMICSFDDADCFVTVNDACECLMGYSPEQLKRRPLADFLHPDEKEKTLRTLRSARTGLASVALTIRCQRRDHSYVEIAWSFQWSSHYRNLFGVGRAVTGTESLRAWDTAG